MTFLLPFNNATRLAANYASSPPARLALMTYRRQDSFVTTPQRDAMRRDATIILGATFRALHSALLSARSTLAIDGGHEFEQTGTFKYRANKNETREEDFRYTSAVQQTFPFTVIPGREAPSSIAKLSSHLVRSPRKLKNVSPRGAEGRS